MAETLISDVSDTALWVAAYRDRETARPDALFHDPLAGRLAGEKGRKIAETVGRGNYVAWMIAVRTRIIDAFINELIAEGVDTVVNLGAGLDTRPYRLALPATLDWIEVDYANIIDLKETRLRDEQPRCRLRRVKLDLTDRAARNALFDEISAGANKALVLTEGVVPYLKNTDVAALADDLHARDKFRWWIADYFAPVLLRVVRWGGLARRRLRNAPFQFSAEDTFGFFSQHGWQERETRYLVPESRKFGRAVPSAWLITLLRAFVPRDKRDRFRGYTLFERN
jgi:methyltransferase (TIGR00027 family)